MQHLQHLEIAVDRFGALDVEDGRQRACRVGVADIRGAPADPHGAFRRARDAQQQRHQLQGEPLRIGQLRFGRERHVVLRLTHDLVAVRLQLARRDEDGEEPAREAALARAWQVEMAFAVP